MSRSVYQCRDSGFPFSPKSSASVSQRAAASALSQTLVSQRLPLSCCLLPVQESTLDSRRRLGQRGTSFACFSALSFLHPWLTLTFSLQFSPVWSLLFVSHNPSYFLHARSSPPSLPHFFTTSGDFSAASGQRDFLLAGLFFSGPKARTDVVVGDVNCSLRSGGSIVYVVYSNWSLQTLSIGLAAEVWEDESAELKLKDESDS